MPRNGLCHFSLRATYPITIMKSKSVLVEYHSKGKYVNSHKCFNIDEDEWFGKFQI